MCACIFFIILLYVYIVHMKCDITCPADIQRVAQRARARHPDGARPWTGLPPRLHAQVAPGRLYIYMYICI